MIKEVRYIGLLAAVLFLLASCLKDEPTVTTTQTVSVNVVNATTVNAINFYLNGTRQNSVTGIYPLAANGYTALPLGNQVLAFKRLFNNQNFENADTLFTLPVRLDTLKSSDQRYSIFAGGFTRSTAFMVKDTIVSDTKNAKIRFVVASPEVTGMRVFMNDTLRFTSSAFKSVSTFKAVGNGQKVIKIFNGSSTTPIYTATVTLVANNVYTLFTAGNATTFKAGLISNN